VVWVNGMGDQVGLESLDGRSIWGSPLPGHPARSSPPVGN
jgi:hypothetical protein